MKIHFILISALFLSFYILVAQCPEGDVIFNSQEEIDNFVAEYPDCSIINGNLEIGTRFYNYTIENLTGLEKINIVKGNLYIKNNKSLNDLNGLQNIATIGKVLFIHNTKLISLDGLIGITAIGTNLYITSNDSLQTLNGLQNITNVQEHLTISRNENLVNLNGL